MHSDMVPVNADDARQAIQAEVAMVDDQLLDLARSLSELESLDNRFAARASRLYMRHLKLTKRLTRLAGN